jgi:hypothetical protein
MDHCERGTTVDAMLLILNKEFTENENHLKKLATKEKSLCTEINNILINNLEDDLTKEREVWQSKLAQDIKNLNAEWQSTFFDLQAVEKKLEDNLTLKKDESLIEKLEREIKNHEENINVVINQNYKDKLTLKELNRNSLSKETYVEIKNKEGYVNAQSHFHDELASKIDELKDQIKQIKVKNSEDIKVLEDQKASLGDKVKILQEKLDAVIPTTLNKLFY